ncbi:uncharacterized protein AC631_00170 [Debaryomyces fabryi]|uniref:RHO1 GDP-GTP exchange protein 2 n=1 Tax=Debaryomyces fabryi TaxID=58627 RepID=A0A0V1Q6H9_9ASCO|nr:uncharacterized protein AC631_00170 [Debaryomyces fabryi]KSA04091.1 hypothetical protein AC631_00170 [Debaryomyces fabryi]CUM50161.1 unnamed protein product [Debaryomyces fabryi]
MSSSDYPIYSYKRNNAAPSQHPQYNLPTHLLPQALLDEQRQRQVQGSNSPQRGQAGLNQPMQANNSPQRGQAGLNQPLQGNNSPQRRQAGLNQQAHGNNSPQREQAGINQQMPGPMQNIPKQNVPHPQYPSQQHQGQPYYSQQHLTQNKVQQQPTYDSSEFRQQQHPQKVQQSVPNYEGVGNGRPFNGPRNASLLSLTYDTSGTGNYNKRVNSYSSQESIPQSQAPYPISGNVSNANNYGQDPPQFPQQRRTARKAPPGSLPPIQTKQVLDSSGRRIVSSPSVPQYNSYSYANHSPISQTSGQMNNEARTKSLSSTSAKPYHQQQQQLRMKSIPQGQPSQPSPQQNNYQNHRPSSSGSGSSSSGHSFSLTSKSRSFTSLSKLSSLSTKKFNSSTSLQGGKLDRNPSSATLSSQKTVTTPMPRKPIVYPAMLSRVARVFKETIILTINTKDGLEYHDTFTGKMAVDIICNIIRTNDRNLALLIGRSLDAQKFFRDVTYNHRLRDSIHEVYAFNHIYSDVEFYQDFNNTNNNSANNSKHGSLTEGHPQFQQVLLQQLPAHTTNSQPPTPSTPTMSNEGSTYNLNNNNKDASGNTTNVTGVNGVFTILTDCYSPTCNRNNLCYSIACPRRLEQQARLNLKPQGGLKRAVSRLSLHDKEENKTLWYETVPQSILDKLDKREKMRQELIYEFIYTERDYVKDLEFMTDFYIMPLRNPANNIIPEREREVFIRTVFGGVSDLLRLAKNMSEALTRRQLQQKPVIDTFADIFVDFVGGFDPFIKYSGNKVFASFEHERQQQVNMKYARFLDAIEKKPESRKQDLSSFLIKGIQRPARYQLLISGIIKNTDEESPDYKPLLKAKEEIEKVLVQINIQTGESTDRHKIMVLHRLLGKQILETKNHFKLNYNHRIIYQVTLNRKRDNEKIDLYLFEHALLLVKHKIQNKREQHKIFEKPIYLPLLFVNSGYDIPTARSIMGNRLDGSLLSDPNLKSKAETSTSYINTSSSSNNKLPINFLGLGSNLVHATLFADDLTNQNQVLQQIYQQQKKLIDQNDIFSLSKYETRRFHGNNKINCAVPCYGGKKLLYGTDSGVWVSTVRSISATSNEKICSDPTMVISKVYVTQIEVLVEYSKLLILSDKSLYEFDLSCTDSLDHNKNTRSGKLILNYVSFFKTGICDGRLLVCAAKHGSTHSINIFEPTNPFDHKSLKNKNKKYDIREISFSSDPVSISFLKTKLCVGCTKGFEILSLEKGKKEPILDEADPSLDFATQRESVTPLAIHRLGKNFLLSYSEFSFKINRNGWRTQHDWSVFWEGNPQNIALFYPYLLSFEPGFIEVRDLDSTNLLRALVGENIRFLHSNEHEALYACEENGYDIIVSIDFLNLKPKITQL